MKCPFCDDGKWDVLCDCMEWSPAEKNFARHEICFKCRDGWVEADCEECGGTARVSLWAWLKFKWIMLTLEIQWRRYKRREQEIPF